MDFGGFTISTFYAFTEMYRFVKTYMQSVKAYAENFTIQTSPAQYEQFIKDIEYVQKIYPDYDDETRNRIRRVIDQSNTAKQRS